MTYVEYHKLIIAFVLAAARIGGALAICPAFSSSLVTGLIRRGAVLSFAMLVVPLIIKDIPAGEVDLYVVGAAAFKEALIGFVIGFIAAVPFWVAENIGNLIDNQRGATMGEVYSPLSGTQVSSTGIFFTQVVVTVFYASGGVLVLLGAIYVSYTIFPVFGPAPSLVADAHAASLGMLDQMLRTTVIISSPIIILMFLATLGLGFVNRTAPQLNVFFLSMPIKSALGVLMLIFYLPFILDRLMFTKEGEIIGPLMQLLEKGSP